MENFLEFDPKTVTNDENILALCQLQLMLQNITNLSIPEIIEFCKTKIPQNEIGVQVRIFIQIRPKNLMLYTDLLFSLLNQFGNDFKRVIFEHIPSLVIKLLYLKGCFLLDEIEAIRYQKRDIDLYFAPEFKLTSVSRGNNKCFADKSGNIDENLITNDYEKYQELVVNDCFIDSMEYAAKHDKIEVFQRIDSLTKQETEDLLSTAGLYSSVNVFNILLNKFADFPLSNKVIEKIIEGGNETLINLMEKKGGKLSPFLPFAIKYHQHKFIAKALFNEAVFNFTQAAASLDIKTILFAQKYNIKEDRTWDQYMRSPLHFAAFYGDTALGMYYISNGYNINEKDDDGRSVLYEAVSSGHPEFAQLLIDNGVDVSAKTNEGLTVFQRAFESKNETIKTMFSKLSYFYP